MKTLLLSFLLLISSLFLGKAYAQRGLDLQDLFDRTSLEVGVGLHRIMAPTKNVSSSEFSLFQNFNAGLRYELNESWGVRGSYSHHSFEHNDYSHRNLTMHKLMLEVTYSVNGAYSAGYYYSNRSNFDLVLHAGLGASLLRGEVYLGKDFIKNVQLGVMPLYKLGKRVALHVDIVYVINASQNYTFSGEYAGPDDRTEGFVSATIGLSILLGR